MRILIALTYYDPHKSGLTIYAIRQARALAASGHEVTVLTSQYDRDLPREEWDQGVRILRLPVLFRLSKGVIMPTIPFRAWKLIGESEVVNLHVPQVDAAMLAMLAKLRHKPLVLTYHCDLTMPEGIINRIAGWAAVLANRISAKLADVIVHNTRDFAVHSSFLSRFLDKLMVIQPPVLVEKVTQKDIAAFREKYQLLPDQQVIGMVARLAAEKGVEYLVRAMPDIAQWIPDARVVFVGNYQNVFGEEVYREKLMPVIEQLGNKWTFLGEVSELEKAAFLQVCDVLVLPSINSTESFGIVQVEAMLSGTPVVATDLPGVRQPVLSTGLGRIVPIKDSDSLCKAIVDLLQAEKPVDSEMVEALSKHYSPETVAEAYKSIFRECTEAE
ncbi:MAG: glycosyltransferase family 4 protein [Chloroflexota bacterium]|jgi:glycosyltransferase involved in cell wall biosynthesis|nr:glycosyltransferase family 4 protein [Chloroflexota bacterium]